MPPRVPYRQLRGLPVSRALSSQAAGGAGARTRQRTRQRTRGSQLSGVAKSIQALENTAESYLDVLRKLSYARHAADDQASLVLDLAMRVIHDADQKYIELGPEALTHMSRIAHLHPSIIPSLLVESTESRHYPPELFEALTKLSISPSHPEQYLFVVNDMLQRGLEPSPDLVQKTIRACCEWASPRLAIDLVHAIEDGSSKGRRVDLAAWTDILICSAECQYLHGVKEAWNRVSTTKSFSPDEGTLLKVLDVAARWGEPDLAATVLSALSTIAGAEEHHLSALMETYVAAGRVPEALKVLTQIRETGLVPTLGTVEPIVSALTTTDIIDQAFYGIEDMHKAGEAVDISAVNALISASVRLGDLRRVRATQAVIGEIGLKPDIDTFNLVLEGCIRASHRPLGDTVLAEMQEAGIEPDRTTYERMIELCLVPDEYEDAFYYLEKMKAAGFKPLPATYNSILQKCALAEDKRWKLVQDEMAALGYKVDQRTRRLINDQYLQSQRRRPSPSSSAP